MWKKPQVKDSRERPVPGIYRREDDDGKLGKFVAGYRCPLSGRWRMVTLPDATNLTEAVRAREALLTDLRLGRVAAKNGTTFGEVFVEHQDSRTLSPRTMKYESDLVSWHLATLRDRPVQSITATEVAKILRAMKQRYSPWTCVAAFRILNGTLGHAERRGILSKNPVDGLAPSERPKQRNAKEIKRLDAAEIKALVSHGCSERWRCAIALAGYAGLRIGEIRGLRWSDIDLDATGMLRVERSLLPDGTPKAPKTQAGVRAVPMLPALRRALVAWKLRSPYTRDADYVIITAEGKPVAYRNLRRALGQAVKAAKFDAGDERLSWHSLRHSAGSMLITELGLPPTTVARIIGHADPGFTLKVYARDPRDEATVTADVLSRAAEAGVGV